MWKAETDAGGKPGFAELPTAGRYDESACIYWKEWERAVSSGGLHADLWRFEIFGRKCAAPGVPGASRVFGTSLWRGWTGGWDPGGVSYSAGKTEALSEGQYEHSDRRKGTGAWSICRRCGIFCRWIEAIGVDSYLYASFYDGWKPYLLVSAENPGCSAALSWRILRAFSTGSS